jgi:hypothetical protein
VAKKDDAAETEARAAKTGVGEPDPGANSSAKRRKALGLSTVATPCLIGAGLLTVLGAALPR